ncbi:ATP-binding protein [Rhodospirillum centenum]|nr:ATP-binding protein [Rhodospirillum centenum]
MAFFDFLPDPGRGPDDLAGELRWVGTRFGVRGLEESGLRVLADAVVAEDRAAFLDIFLPGGESSRAGEFRIAHGDGRIGFVHFDICCGGQGEGRPSHVFGTLHDVTDLRHFEALLNDAMREREMLLAVIDACPISIAVADARRPDTPLIYVNRIFQTLTGYDRAEVMGRNCRFLHGPGTDDAAVGVLHEAIRTGSRADVRLLNYRKDGSTFLNHLVLAPIHDETGTLSAYIGLQSDVTDEARREEIDRQRQRVEALGRMMGGVAHEINNLLQPVTLLTEELMRRQRSTADTACLHTILDCALSARRIIGDLLAFSRPGGRETEVVDAAALLRDALVLVRKAVGPGILIRFDDGGGTADIHADRTAFIQVLLNLANNAAAAMGGEGTIDVTLSVGPAPRGAGGQVRIAVADTGCGMDGALLERAFEPFFTTKPVGQGTGLGLSVAFGLVKEMGGEIILESTPDRGTTAIVLLPAVQGKLEDGHDSRR